MNSKQKKTLANIFSTPVKTNIKWTAVESLIKSLGGTIDQGSGSRVRIVINDIALNIHTPHPGNELKPYQVRAIRKLFSETGVNNEL